MAFYKSFDDRFNTTVCAKVKKRFVCLCIGIALIFCGCASTATEQGMSWNGFCTTMLQEFGEKSGTIRPQNVDKNGWCYYLSEDERCIYRINAESSQPEAIIKDAVGCMTVTDYGILFLRVREHYISDIWQWTKYDLTLWQDGIEVVVWKDASISPQDGCMATVGAFLVYKNQDVVCVRPILLENGSLSIGATIGTLPDCTAMQRLLWTDGNTLFYALRDGYYKIYALRQMDIVSKKCTDIEITGLIESGWDVRHPWPMAVNDRGLYYLSGNVVYQQDLNTMATYETYEIQKGADAQLYGTATGGCFLQLKDYHKNPALYTTIDMDTGRDMSFLGKGIVQTVCGNIVIVHEHEYVNDYDFYPRTVLYRLDTGKEIWRSKGMNLKSNT